ncbi:hypothetical protein BKA62DRAFT_460576 [Auriculariales sp. MPI-PUGE-AT-0066]|nr:hypothetical protein BKA62DRAFT_460576 [Auriculariales sp. MPI-PUGE-AT-0066]
MRLAQRLTFLLVTVPPLLPRLPLPMARLNWLTVTTRKRRLSTSPSPQLEPTLVRQSVSSRRLSLLVSPKALSVSRTPLTTSSPSFLGARLTLSRLPMVRRSKLFKDEQAAEAEAAEAGDEAAYDSSNFVSLSRARDIRVHKERSRELEKLDKTNESGRASSADSPTRQRL